MGILKLPGESTLRDYTSVFSAAPGFQGQVLEDLQLQVENYDAEQRYVCLLHDEMSIKSDLVFDRKSNKLIGYVSPQEFDIQKVCGAGMTPLSTSDAELLPPTSRSDKFRPLPLSSDESANNCIT